MVVLLDTNIALTYILGREDKYNAAIEIIFDLISRDKINACMAIHSFSTMWYVLRKLYTDEETRGALKVLIKLVDICSTTTEGISEAIDDTSFRDFEDCLQEKCALAGGADYIITANIKDFENSELRAMNPDDFILLPEIINMK